MAPRKAVAAKSTRAPLQDASGSVLNTAAQKKQPRPQADKLDFNPLRAHPPAVRVHRPTPNGSVTSGRSSDQPNVYVDSRDASLLDHDIDEDKRHSHISTSSASSSKRKTHIGPWHLGKTLGKGAAGRVRLARHRVTQQPVAVKIISKNACHMTQAGSIAELDKWDRKRGENKTDNQMPFSIEREVAILKLIEHPNIVRLYDIWENRAEM